MSETIRVFLSSTGGDLDAWREAVARALERKPNVEIIRMEAFVPTGLPPLDLCLEKVAASDMLVGMIGFRYGSAIPGRVTSFTQAEYEEAVRLGRPCLMHVVPAGHELAAVDHGETEEVCTRLERLRARVMRANTAARPEAWDSPADLALHVSEGVQQEIERQRAARAPGFTQEKYGARIKGRLEQIAELMAAEDAELEQLSREKAELERRFWNLEESFLDAKSRIRELEKLLERDGNHLGSERLGRAEQALADGDFDEADRLLAEIEDDEDLAIKRAARAAFGRGKIAEERIAWVDAAKHYAKAARLDPGIEHLKKTAAMQRATTQFRAALRTAQDLVDFTEETCAPDSAAHLDALTTLALARADLLHGKAGKAAIDRATEIFLPLLGDTLQEQTAVMLGDGTELVEKLGTERAKVFADLCNMVAVQQVEFGVIDQAVVHLEITIRIRRLLDGRDTALATALSNLAMAKRDLNLLDEADALLLEARDILRDRLGEMHPAYADVLTKLGGLQYARPNYVEAARLYLQARDLIQDSIGVYTLQYADIEAMIAQIFRSVERFNDAQIAVENALHVRRTIHGNRHFSIATLLNELGLIHYSAQRHEEAVACYQEAIEINRAIEFGPSVIALHQHNLANAYQALGQFDDAGAAFAEAVPVLRDHHGDDHPNAVQAAINHAIFLRKHAPDDLALVDLQDAFGPTIGQETS
ncbi:MAG: tetratricopeptide repeat protein [Pseudomonadota bacterium]